MNNIRNRLQQCIETDGEFNYNYNYSKYLNVSEKNNVAKSIALILSNGQLTTRAGATNWNDVYEFDGSVSQQPAKMVVTSVNGHLVKKEFGNYFKSWELCKPNAVFYAPVIVVGRKYYQNFKETLEHEIRSCKGLIIWTDCDREGESIGFEIIKLCKYIKPNIEVHRAKFYGITEASVFNALNNLVRPDENVSNAVDVRQELDLRTGAAFTRMQTLALRKFCPFLKLNNEMKIISYGSCQLPTLGFVVDSHKAHEEFIPKPFWRIKMNHIINDNKMEFYWKEDKLFDKNACQIRLDRCQKNSEAKVELCKIERTKQRPAPLDTVKLMQEISRMWKINVNDAMNIAEDLYIQGYISYPRTVANEIDLVKIVEQQSVDPQWGDFAKGIRNPNPRQGQNFSQAHPPIHPTKYACVSKDAVGYKTIVHVNIGDEKFFAEGLVIMERNYLDVYTYEKWNAKEIHNYQNGDTFMPSELNLAEGLTTRPPLLHEADLIALMVKYGIGTETTYADHIETLKQREYVTLTEDEKYLVPTALGRGLVQGYNNIGLEVSLAKPNLRVDFEKELKLICEERKNAELVRKEQIEKYWRIFEKVKKNLKIICSAVEASFKKQASQVNLQKPEEPPEKRSKTIQTENTESVNEMNNRRQNVCQLSKETQEALLNEFKKISFNKTEDGGDAELDKTRNVKDQFSESKSIKKDDKKEAQYVNMSIKKRIHTKGIKHPRPLSSLPSDLSTSSQINVKSNILQPQRMQPLNTSTPKHKVQELSQGSGTPCVACTGMSQKQLQAITALANRKLIRYSNNFNSSVTHLIVAVNQNGRINKHTRKYIFAVASGLWILRFNWIEKCLRKDELVGEHRFEVQDISGVFGPTTSRLNKNRDPLFKDFKMYIADTYMFSKQEIENIIKLLGGEIVTRPDDLLTKNDKVCLIIAEAKGLEDLQFYKMCLEDFDVSTVDLKWLCSSIAQHMKLSFRPYLLCSDVSILSEIDSILYPDESEH